jgi:hypothetical protein
MGFLRRLLGGETHSPAGETGSPTGEPRTPDDRAAVDAEETARDLELLREDQARLDDLAQRQLRYAQYAWEPPAQGGERRADDGDATGEQGDRG